MKLEWRHAFTISDSYGTAKAFAFGPFMMYEYQQRGFFQVKRVFIDHEGKSYRSEESFIYHIDYLVKKAKQG
jgi:hypothetical protein